MSAFETDIHKSKGRRIKDAFIQFSRNGQWGTCVDCPRTEDQTLPEFCVNRHRYDHKLNLEQLVEYYKKN